MSRSISDPGSPDPDSPASSHSTPGIARSPRPPRRDASSRRTLRIVAVAAVVLVLAAAAFAWRAHRRRRVVTEGLARAETLLRGDTHGSYLDAERLLDPLSELDPGRAGAMRGFALAMLALDGRDEDAGRRAEAVLVEPGRAAEMSRFAQLGYGALALARGEAGTATTYAARAGDDAWAAVLQARIALVAGKLDVARDALDGAAAADPGFPAVQAIRGDVLRRTGHATQARDAYLAALHASPKHARAAFGLSKLALGNAGSADDAREALRRLLADNATGPRDRARAAYHLASIEARAGHGADATDTIERAGVDGKARAWIERAVAEQAQATEYRVVPDAPAAVDSPSDDDPYVAPPRPPPSTAVSPTFRIPEPAPQPPPPKRPHAAAPKGAGAKAHAVAKASAKPRAPGKKAAKAPAASRAKGAARTAAAKKTGAKTAPKKRTVRPPAKGTAAR